MVEVNVPLETTPVPGDVRTFLHEAQKRIARFQSEVRVPGFVPSDFGNTYSALTSIAVADLALGHWFCEWGSGFGVATCLAAMLGFDAWGIEIEGELVDAARRLAEDFDLPVQFVRGSFIPRGNETASDAAVDFAWLATGEDSAYEELGLDIDEFDVIFAYPWPDEERLIENLFKHYAAAGAVLLTNHGLDDLRFRRKTGARQAYKALDGPPDSTVNAL